MSADEPLTKGKGPVGKRKSEHTTEKQSSKVSKPDNTKWTSVEKGRLIEGIKWYGQDYRSIAKHVGSKSAEQVQEKIEKLSSSVPTTLKQARVTSSNSQEAPIELWTDLIQEIMAYEEDISTTLPEALGLIMRNTKFDDSSIYNLQWKNIYQYILDLLEGRLSVKPLTQVESLVVLDLLNTLNDELKEADTSEQQRVLKLKFAVLNVKFGQTSKPNLEREVTAGLISQAFSNNFKEIESIIQGNFAIEEVKPCMNKPKYLSLNPLCIAPDLIELKKKT